MRVLIAVDGTRGDVHPMLELGASLRDRGHDVRVCAPPDFAPAAEQRGLAFHCVGGSVQDYLRAEASMLHGGALTTSRAGERYLRESLPAQMRDLMSVAGGTELVIASGTQLAAFSVAERVGARYRMVCYDPAVLRSSEQTPAMLPIVSAPRWATRLIWTVLLRSMQLRLLPAVNRERAAIDLPPISDLYARLVGERPVLAAEERLAPPPSDAGPVDVIGCLHPFAERELPAKLEGFLASGPRPIYVGFGSMTDPEPARSTRMILEAVERAGVRAVLASGWAGLGEGALPGDVIVVGAVEHASLFGRVRAVVHHGGAGTTTTAARAGVPQVLTPHVLDQIHWAHRIARLGLGPPACPRRKLTADRLAAAIRAGLDNDALAERAMRVGSQLRAQQARRPSPALAFE